MKNVVKTDQAPGAIGPYSQGIQVGDMYFFSGQIPLVPSTGEMPEGIEAQAHQALKNVKGLLESQGLSFSNVVKTTVFLKDMNDFSAMNEVYQEYFEEPYPARSACSVSGLLGGALVEIEAIAIDFRALEILCAQEEECCDGSCCCRD